MKKHQKKADEERLNRMLSKSIKKQHRDEEDDSLEDEGISDDDQSDFSKTSPVKKFGQGIIKLQQMGTPDSDQRQVQERRKKAAKELYSHLRVEKKMFSKVFQYFTGDEYEEFENDIPYEDLAEFSDSELPDRENSASKARQNRSHSNKHVEKILGKVSKLGGAFTQIHQSLRSNMRAANNHVRDVQMAGLKPISR